MPMTRLIIGAKLSARNDRGIVSVQTTPVDDAGVTSGDCGETIVAIAQGSAIDPAGLARDDRNNRESHEHVQ